MAVKGLYLYLLPTLEQAKKVIWNDEEMMKHFPPEAIVKKNESEHWIKLASGSIWMLGGVDKPANWRGTNPIDIVFDEYPWMDPEVWTAVFRPVLANNKGSATFAFTPDGLNHAHDLLLEAKASTDPSMWAWWVLGVDITKAIDETELAETRKNMPAAFYDQEFLCKFLENASSVFRRVRDNVWDGNLKVTPSRIYDLGVDLARKNDWTVITPFDRHTWKVGFQERFNQIDWPLQKAKIEAAALRYNKARVKVDATGVGDPIQQDLARQGLTVEPIVFTERGREEMLSNLSIKLEQDLIKIPNDEGLIEELLSARYELAGPRGKTRISWPSNLTDDRVMSLALAIFGNENKVAEPLMLSRSSELRQELDDLTPTQSRFHFEE